MIVESDEDVEVLQAVRECRPAVLAVLASFGLGLLPLLHRSKVDREGLLNDSLIDDALAGERQQA
jgi:hypothetical protein